jgi:predicted DNA-binding transcriptional regulator AlpA
MVDLDTLPDTALLDDEQAAGLLSIRKTTLQVWRSTNRVQLPYVKVGRLVRYRAGDLRAFIESRVVG